MEAWAERNADERTWSVVDAVGAIADAHGVSSSQVALAWLAAQPAVTSVILGARTVDQLRDNLGAIDLELTQSELSMLTEVSAPRIDDYPYGAAGVAQRHRSIGGGR
jgi:aryl-alcohol dehydrogenase-like predicted oxidoreductase